MCPAFCENLVSPDFNVTIFSAPQLNRSTFVGSLAWSGVLAATIVNIHKNLKNIVGRLAMVERT